MVSAAFSPDGTRVVTASWDKTARVWDAATGKPLTTPARASGRGVERRVQPRRHARGHRELGQDRAGVGRGDRQAAHRPARASGAVWSAAFSPDGTRVVTASDDKTARVWDAATGKPLTRPAHASGPGEERRVQPRRHARGHRERRQDRAGVGRGDRQAADPPARASGQVWSAAFSPDGTRVVTASYDRTARVWDAATGQPLSAPLDASGPGE